MTDKPQYPLVTFALFAYNQEKYIREAVEAALAQEYPNLEIIISDDRSVDATFEIACALVENYRGPHKVCIRKTEHNLGPFRHVLDVARTAEGELLVLAAGDDLSKSCRVSKLVEAWKQTNAWGLHSNYDKIDGNSLLIEPNTNTKELFESNFDLRNYFLDPQEVGIVHGATSAYDAKLFRKINIAQAPWILSEDGALSLVINILGHKVVHIQQSLVSYRVHAAALTNVCESEETGADVIRKNIRKAADYAISCRNRANFILQYAQLNHSQVQRPINESMISIDVKRQELRGNWYRLNFVERLKLVIWKTPDLIWLAPRIFGMNFYISVKMLADRLRSVF